MRLSESLKRLVYYFFPKRCLKCGDYVKYGEYLCEKCHFEKIGRVKLFVANRITDTVTVLEYSGDNRKLIWKVKDNKEPRIYDFFALEMHKLMHELWDSVHFDMIVPVPTTKAKIKSKGYNQVELLAAPLCRLSGIPVQSSILTRLEESETQHDLKRAQRRENAERSYGIAEPDKVVGKTILLLDDLLTTAYTVAVCANRILDAGAKAVYVLTAANTPPRTYY